jgi:hypothetical protein
MFSGTEMKTDPSLHHALFNQNDKAVPFEQSEYSMQSQRSIVEKIKNVQELL